MLVYSIVKQLKAAVRAMLRLGIILGLVAVPMSQAATAQAALDAGVQEAAVDSAEMLTAHAVVERTTEQLVALIEEAKQYIDKDEGRFYRELGELLQDYVDFQSFSRAVMGRYASSARMESLEPAQAEKLQRQIDRFAEIFTEALINTYGKGLLVFEGERIEVVPPDDKQVSSQSDRAKVKQLIYGDRDTPYEIFYSLRKNAAGEWKIRNMILETTNLGKVYRNQFDNAYKVYEGDIDLVIENWVSG